MKKGFRIIIFLLLIGISIYFIRYISGKGLFMGESEQTNQYKKDEGGSNYNNFSEAVKNSFSFEEIDNQPLIEYSNYVVNQTNEYYSYSYCEEFCYINVYDKNTDKTYKLFASSFAKNRPFINLEWASNYTLSFDQSSQPNYALHYEVNIVSKKMEVIVPIGK